MAQIVGDSFTGTAGTAIETYNPNWVVMTGITGIASIDATGTRLRQTSGSTGTAVFYRSDAVPASADYSVSSDVYVNDTAGTGSGGVIIRSITTAQTFYHARFLNGTGVQLLRYVSGTATTLGSALRTVVVGETVNIKLEATGSTINVYVNGSATPDISVTDTNITVAGYPGVRFLNLSGGQLRLDNFSADQAGASTPTGTLASTLGNGSMSASGKIIHAGSFSSALDSLTMSSSGNVAGAPSGSMASTLDSMAMSATGALNDSGAFLSTLGNVTMNASGAAAQHASGTIAVTLGGATMSASAADGFALAYARRTKQRTQRVLRRHFTE